MAHIDKNNILEILGKKIPPGKGAVINLNMAKVIYHYFSRGSCYY